MYAPADYKNMMFKSNYLDELKMISENFNIAVIGIVQSDGSIAA